MPRIYAVTYNGTLTAAGTDTDLISLQAASNKPIRLRGYSISQSSEVGDASEEGLRITVKRLPATWTVGSGGSSITATKPVGDPGGNTWGFTARGNDTTVGTSSGTVEVLHDTNWNERNSPYDYWWPDVDFCPVAQNAVGLVIRCETTAADDLTVSITAHVEEMG